MKFGYTRIGDRMKNKSYFLDNFEYKHINPKMTKEVDILIIGGGMTGLMTAYELSKKNKDIVIVEADRIYHGVSSKTTAKLTIAHNQLYQDIAKYHGLKKARLYYHSQKEALEFILNIIKKEKIECDLETVDNYIYAETEEGVKKIEKEFSILRKIGVNMEIFNNLELDIKMPKAIRIEKQAIFHPVKYLERIKEIIEERKVKVYENYTVTDFNREEGYYKVNFENGESIKAKKIIIASHYPFLKFTGLYFAKLYQEKNYLIAFKSTKRIQGMYINSETPVRSLRACKDNVLLMVGNSHKAGEKVEYEEQMQSLRDTVYEFDKQAEIINEWTNQDVMSIDSLPFIGKASRFYNKVYVATAFHTWGMTNSHVAAQLLTDEVLGVKNKYRELYSPLRFSHIRSPIESIKIIAKAINGLIIARFFQGKKKQENIRINSGGVINYKNGYYAAFRKNQNEYIYLKPDCTHTKCFIQWNDAEKTWDCKCHGSRFGIYGNVISGPAVKPLKRVFLE